MLIMLPNKMRILPLERVFPYDENDLMIAISERVIFGLREIRDSAGSVFSIKGIIEARPDVFGKESFSDRTKSFSKLLFTRMERFFKTKRSDYIYFDNEEQEYLSEKIFLSNSLTANVEIYLVNEDSLIKVNFDSLATSDYSMVRKELGILGAVAVMQPQSFVMMNEKAAHYDKFNNERMKKFRVDKKIEEMFNNYPGLRDCKTKKEFGSIYKRIAKDLHPDGNDGMDPAIFQKFQEDIRYIKKSRWFKGLI